MQYESYIYVKMKENRTSARAEWTTMQQQTARINTGEEKTDTIFV